MRRLRRLALFGLVIGCGAPPRPPGTIVVLVESRPESLDRRFALSVTSQRIASLIAPGLVRVDASGQPEPDLAESWQLVEPTRIRFVLRSGLTFHDGRPVTAEDVAYTFRSLHDPALGSPLSSKYRHVVGADVIDEQTVDILLDEPFAPALLDLSMGGAPIGAGPFRYAGHLGRENVLLTAFDHYRSGRPAIERLEFRVVRDETTRVLTFLHGDADFLVNAVSHVLLPRLEAAPNLTVRHAPGTGYAYMAFNLRHPILSDVRVRRAIAHALDRDAIARYKFKGAATPATGMLPGRHWAFAPGRSWSHDPEAAKRLLDAAGYPDPDGDGPATRFSVTYKTSTDRFRRSIALIFVEQLRQVGIAVDLRAYEWGTFYGDIKRGRFEICTLKWTPVIEPHLMHWVFHSSSIPTEENGWRGGNRGGYENLEVDRKLDEAARLSDPDERRRRYGRVQEILADELPYVPLWHEDTVAVVSDRFAAVDVSPFGFLYPLAGAELRSAP